MVITSILLLTRIGLCFSLTHMSPAVPIAASAHDGTYNSLPIAASAHDGTYNSSDDSDYEPSHDDSAELEEEVLIISLLVYPHLSQVCYAVLTLS